MTHLSYFDEVFVFFEEEFHSCGVFDEVRVQSVDLISAG